MAKKATLQFNSFIDDRTQTVYGAISENGTPLAPSKPFTEAEKLLWAIIATYKTRGFAEVNVERASSVSGEWVKEGQ